MLGTIKQASAQRPAHPPSPVQPPTPAMAPSPPAHDPIEANLFPPELVMQHEGEIRLTGEQRAYIKHEAIAAQTKFAPLQWDMQEEMGKMKTLVEGEHVDEVALLAQLDRVLDLERQVKHIHLTLAARIKNKLTPDQQKSLQSLRK